MVCHHSKQISYDIEINGRNYESYYNYENMRKSIMRHKIFKDESSIKYVLKS